jgi:hypothetical protein
MLLIPKRAFMHAVSGKAGYEVCESSRGAGGTPRPESRAGGASGEYAVQEHWRYTLVLLGEVAGVPLDHREGIDREGRVLPYKPIHGGSQTDDSHGTKARATHVVSGSGR